MASNRVHLKFIEESLRIEGIERPPTQAEVNEFYRFMALELIEIKDLERFVHIYQPGAVIRDQPGYDIRIGEYYPPPGGPRIRLLLSEILYSASCVRADKIEQGTEFNPCRTHCAYESLHPFMDGNGRSGRMIWMWQMRNAPLGFLHTYYYQCLQEMRAYGTFNTISWPQKSRAPDPE